MQETISKKTDYLVLMHESKDKSGNDIEASTKYVAAKKNEISIVTVQSLFEKALNDFEKLPDEDKKRRKVRDVELNQNP